MIAEEIERKSFDFQAREYMKTLVSDFEKDFPAQVQDEEKGKGPYIDLNGETRVFLHEKDEYRKSGDTWDRANESEGKEDANWKDRYRSTAYQPLDEYINQWLADDGRRFLMIVGEYGTGKTTFLRHMARQLALARQDCEIEPGTSIYERAERVPLYFPLREFDKDIESFILTRFNRAGIEDINYPGFLDRLGKGELLLMLDGFDEMTQRIDADEKKRNFARIRGLIEHGKASKVILTVRHEYFRSLADLEDVVKYEGKAHGDTVYLMGFDDEQIKHFLRTRIDNPEFYWKHIEETFDLKDLAKRPVLLQLIVDHLPQVIEEKGKDQPVIASDLYNHCIKTEMERKSNDLPFEIPNKCRLEILERLAVWMFVNDALNFDIKILEDDLNFERYFPGKTSWEIEKYLNEFLTFSFLIREGHNRFRMSHKSFRDYMTAIAFVREINSGQIEHFGKNQTTYEINHFIVEQRPDREKLLQVVENSRNLPPERKYQGGNGCNILLRIDRKALKGRNLSRCRMFGVDFWRCDLAGTDFSWGELRNCQLDETILIARYRDINVEGSFLYLRYSQLEDIKFITAFKNLSGLDLSFTKLSDVGALSKLKGLTQLYLRVNQLSDVSALSELKGLKVLHLSSNQLSDVQALSELKRLEILHISGNKLTDITPLGDLMELTELYLSGNKLTDVTPLAGLKGLRVLRIQHNQLTDVKPLIGLKGLTVLHIDSNKLIDVTPLAELKGLMELRLHRNQLIDVTPLVKLKQLRQLLIDKNQKSTLAQQLNMLKEQIPGLEIEFI